MAGTVTKVNPNLVLKATETDLKEEYFNELFWEAQATEQALSEDNYMDVAPESIMTRKSEKLKMGAKYIEFGETDQLEGEGTYEGGVLAGAEEAIESKDNAVYFTTIRHGVPFPLKELDAHYNEAFNLLQKRQRALSIWNGRVSEQWHWQAFVKGCPDEVNRVHGSESPQRFHPNIYTFGASSVTQVPWNATASTHESAIASAIAGMSAGDNVNVDQIWEMETIAADLNIRKVPFNIMGEGNQSLWLWVYPRSSRIRMKTALKDFFLSGDVRGPGNRTLEGEKYKFGQFLFCEAAWINRLTQSGGTTVSLQESWAYNATTNKREDQRADVQGVMHAILGVDALCLAEPESLQYDFERTDYKAKEGIGTYRLTGSRRMEVYDDRNNPTEVRNQNSILMIEHANAT